MIDTFISYIRGVNWNMLIAGTFRIVMILFLAWWPLLS